MSDVATTVCSLISEHPECEWIEFKHSWFEPHALGEYISALSNGAAMEGRPFGYFIWGVDDKTHNIVGTDFDFDQDVKGEPLKHYLARQTSPSINFTFQSDEVDGLRVVLLTIPAAQVSPTAFDKKRYIRIGSSKERLAKFPEHEAALFDVLKHGRPSIENTPSQYQELSFEKLHIYYASKGLPLTSKTFEKNLGLRCEDGQYNLLAQLLSDNSHIPIRVAIFPGESKADNMYSIREFGYQCILYSLDDVLRYGDVLNIIQADETHRVVERKEEPLFDNKAFREAIINAFVHNAWILELEPMITVFSNRIEILSRGKLAPGQTLEGFFAGESIPVNPKLAEIIMQLHISERTGRGVPAIADRYGRQAFEFRENSIVVTIPFKWINVMADRVGDKVGYKVGERDRMLTGAALTQERILAELRDNPHVTIPQIAQALGMSKASIDKGIAALKADNRVERIGSRKAGMWHVIESDEEGDM